MEHNQWATQRAGKFTASEIWKLFVEPKTKADKEAGKWSQTADNYILMKAIERVTGYVRKFTSKEMEHGIMNEKDAFDAFCSFHKQPYGWKFTNKDFFVIDENSGASPDGVLYDNINVAAVVDVKCPQPATFFERKAELTEDRSVMPKEYFYQLQMQMMATGAPEGYLVNYLAEEFGNTFTGEIEYKFELPLESRIIIQHVPADLAVQAQMRELIVKACARRQYHEKIILNLHE